MLSNASSSSATPKLGAPAIRKPRQLPKWNAKHATLPLPAAGGGSGGSSSAVKSCARATEKAPGDISNIRSRIVDRAYTTAVPSPCVPSIAATSSASSCPATTSPPTRPITVNVIEQAAQRTLERAGRWPFVEPPAAVAAPETSRSAQRAATPMAAVHTPCGLNSNTRDSADHADSHTSTVVDENDQQPSSSAPVAAAPVDPLCTGAPAAVLPLPSQATASALEPAPRIGGRYVSSLADGLFDD